MRDLPTVSPADFPAFTTPSPMLAAVSPTAFAPAVTFSFAPAATFASIFCFVLLQVFPLQFTYLYLFTPLTFAYWMWKATMPLPSIPVILSIRHFSDACFSHPPPPISHHLPTAWLAFAAAPAIESRTAAAFSAKFILLENGKWKRIFG